MFHSQTLLDLSLWLLLYRIQIFPSLLLGICYSLGISILLIFRETPHFICVFSYQFWYSLPSISQSLRISLQNSLLSIFGLIRTSSNLNGLLMLDWNKITWCLVWIICFWSISHWILLLCISFWNIIWSSRIAFI